MQCLQCLYSAYSPGGHFVQWSGLNNFGRGLPKKHVCAIIPKSIHWIRRSLKGFFSIFSSGGHLVQWSGTV